MTKSAIAIIPARGGSKRIPKKNIKDFFGKPLIAYSIQTALESKLFDKVVVSTDNKEIAKIAKEYKAEVLQRPKELADDFTSTIEVIKHALGVYSGYDFACTIYATAPLLQSKYLKEGFEKLQNSDAVYAFSATTMPFPIQRAFKINGSGRCEMFTPECYMIRSQDLEEAYQDAGQFYWHKLSKRSDEIMFGKDSIPILLPRYLVQDIDTLEDWKRVEMMYQSLFPNKFDNWSFVKQKLDAKDKSMFFNERDILFISIGQNVGYEQYGKGEEFLRPVVVIKKFNRELFLGIPLSTKIKKGYFFHQISFKNRINTALLLQVRTFDAKRIKYRLATLGTKEFKKLTEKFKQTITPTQNEKGSD